MSDETPKNLENESTAQSESQEGRVELEKDKEPEFPGLNKDRIEIYSSLRSALFGTIGSIFLLIFTQIMTNCSNYNLENKRRESELIKQALTPENKQADQNLIFLVRSGLVDCHNFIIHDEKEDQGFINNIRANINNGWKHFFEGNQPDKYDKTYEQLLKNYVKKGHSKIDFSPLEKRCSLIKGLITAPPADFGSPSTSNSSKVDLSNSFEKATFFQNQGFNALLKDDIKAAQDSFEIAYQTYPNLYNIYEIRNLLKTKDKQPIEKIYCRIVKDYSWGMPDEIKKKMTEKGKCN